jgi:hypothetical protein
MCAVGCGGAAKARVMRCGGAAKVAEHGAAPGPDCGTRGPPGCGTRGPPCGTRGLPYRGAGCGTRGIVRTLGVPPKEASPPGPRPSTLTPLALVHLPSVLVHSTEVQVGFVLGSSAWRRSGQPPLSASIRPNLLQHCRLQLQHCRLQLQHSSRLLGVRGHPLRKFLRHHVDEAPTQGKSSEGLPVGNSLANPNVAAASAAAAFGFAKLFPLGSSSEFFNCAGASLRGPVAFLEGVVPDPGIRDEGRSKTVDCQGVSIPLLRRHFGSHSSCCRYLH